VTRALTPSWNDFAVPRMNISQSFNKAVKKRAAARYVKLDPKEMDRVAEEIDGTTLQVAPA
jgi:ribosomal protein L22